MLSIAMLIFGIVTLVRGKFFVSKTRAAVGLPAYLAGVILILPLPVSFAVGFAYGAMMAAEGRQVDPFIMLPVELGIIVACLVLAYIIGFSNARDITKKRIDDDYVDRRRDEEDEEDDYQSRRQGGYS